MNDPSLSQVNYRIRLGDTVGLNVDSGWAAALNTGATIDAGILFRVRAEVEETNAGSSATAHKWQFRHKPDGGAFGSWTDVPENGAAGESTQPIMMDASTQFNDGDATTDVLSGSAATFDAGSGDELNPTASVTLLSEHTEFEGCFIMPQFWAGPSQSGTNDTIELRLVESGGTVYAAYDQTPSITINIPNFYIGGIYIESAHRYLIANDDKNLYTFIEAGHATGENECTIIKSADGGQTWTMPDSAGQPTENDIEAIDIDQDGDTLHIIIQDGSGDRDVTYDRFHTSTHATTPDEWDGTVINESIAAATNANDQAVAIFARGDGTVVAFYRYNDGTNERVGYKIRNGTWGSQNNLDTTASVNFILGSAVKGESDKIHIFYRDATNNDIYHKSLSSADSLSAREIVESDSVASTDGQGVTPPVYWDNAGVEEIMVLVYDNSDEILYSVVVSDDGTPETRKQASGVAVDESPGSTGSNQPLADLAIDSATDTAYMLYGDKSTGDLWRDEAVNDGGWGTDVEELDAVNITQVKSTVFTHSAGNGGDKVLGYVYDEHSAGDTGFMRYGEFVITAGAVASSLFQQREIVRGAKV